jgi:hypothetical protein
MKLFFWLLKEKATEADGTGKAFLFALFGKCLFVLKEKFWAIVNAQSNC